MVKFGWLKRSLGGNGLALFVAAFALLAAPALAPAQHSIPVGDAAHRVAAQLDSTSNPAAVLNDASIHERGNTAEHSVSGHSATAATPVHDAEAHHGGAHAEGSHTAKSPELPNFIGLAVESGMFGEGFGHFLHTFEKQIFLVLTVGIVGVFLFALLPKSSMIPGRMQAAAELLTEGLYAFLLGILGDHNKKHIPMLATLFVFIWVNNLVGAIPFFAPATSAYATPLALALMMFFYINFYAMKDGGIGHYFWHLAGSPKDFIGWALSPFMFVLETVGTLSKPVSLSLRLFGNIMGEDIMLGVFLVLGVGLAQAVIPNSPIGIPLHTPFLFMVLLTSTVQALVFTLLCSIYIAIALPGHGHDHEHHDHAEDHTQGGHLAAEAGLLGGRVRNADDDRQAIVAAGEAIP